MKALRLHAYGGPLTTEEIPEPKAAAGQVVVRNVATTLNPIDPKRASGLMKQIFPLEFPWVPGGDAAGVVEQVGPGVTNFKVGDAVLGFNPDGGAYAELVTLDAAGVAKKPDALTYEQAASFAVVGQTATQMLELAGITAGQTVLIHAGAGGVGTMAIQLAHKAGVHVITTAQKAQADALRKLGADRVIDYSTQRFENEIEPVDAVLDLVGGDTQARSYSVIKRGGILVAASQPPDAKQCEEHGIRGTMVQTKGTSEGLTKLVQRIVAGEIVPVIERTETLWNPQGIWAKRPSGSGVGKIVFTVSAS